VLDFFLYAVGAWSSLVTGKHDLAERYIENLGRVFNHQALLNRCVFHDTSAILNIHRGHLDLARAQSDMSLELASRGGMPYAESVCLLTASRVRSLAGDWEGAEHCRQLAADIANSMDNRFILNHLLWFDAADRLRRDGAAASLQPLRQALSAGRTGNFFANLWLERESFAQLCHIALINDIEPDYVRRLIACLDLKALSPAWGNDNWPFRLRVEVLSGLHVKMLTEDGHYRSISLQGRSGQLLEALVWLGGQAVSQEQLADILWPDAEGDSARRSFDTTLHRLRRALDDERLLLLEDSLLSLNPGLVWTDIEALEIARKDLAHALQSSDTHASIEVVQEKLIKNLVSLPTFGSNTRGLETISAALQRNLEQTLDRAGLYWQEHEIWQTAITAFETRLQLNPVAEAPYLQLMRVQIARGLPVEAMAVYQRCKENVKKNLNIKPGPEIEAERRRLLSTSSDT
jgi:DNA-binding SARP family transcriptional activator